MLLTADKPPQKTTLNISQLDSLYKFLSEFKTLKENYHCTTVKYYTVVHENKVIKKYDGGCSWFGYDRLQTAIFGPTE